MSAALDQAARRHKRGASIRHFGSFLNNLSLAVCAGALIYMALRWADLATFLPAITDEEAKSYGQAVFGLALGLNLISYLPLGYGQHLMDSATKQASAGSGSFNFERFKEEKARMEAREREIQETELLTAENTPELTEDAPVSESELVEEKPAAPDPEPIPPRRTPLWVGVPSLAEQAPEPEPEAPAGEAEAEAPASREEPAPAAEVEPPAPPAPAVDEPRVEAENDVVLEPDEPEAEPDPELSETAAAAAEAAERVRALRARLNRVETLVHSDSGKPDQS